MFTSSIAHELMAGYFANCQISSCRIPRRELEKCIAQQSAMVGYYVTYSIRKEFLSFIISRHQCLDVMVGVDGAEIVESLASTFPFFS